MRHLYSGFGKREPCKQNVCRANLMIVRLCSIMNGSFYLFFITYYHGIFYELQQLAVTFFFKSIVIL